MKTQVLKARTADTLNIPAEVVTLETIQASTQALADARTALRDLIDAANKEIDEIKKKHQVGITTAAKLLKDCHETVFRQVNKNRGLFSTPKTRVFADIKVGLRKQKGKLTFEDAEQVVKLIRKHFPEQFDVLVKTEEVPQKDALSKLKVEELKKLGVSVGSDTDAVEIKDQATDLEKLVDALLNGLNKEEAA